MLVRIWGQKSNQLEILCMSPLMNIINLHLSKKIQKNQEKGKFEIFVSKKNPVSRQGFRNLHFFRVKSSNLPLYRFFKNFLTIINNPGSMRHLKFVPKNWGISGCSTGDIRPYSCFRRTERPLFAQPRLTAFYYLIGQCWVQLLIEYSAVFYGIKTTKLTKLN